MLESIPGCELRSPVSGIQVQPVVAAPAARNSTRTARVRVEAVLFDIDETLLDQKRAEAAAAAEFLERYASLFSTACSVTQFCRLWRAARDAHLPDYLNGLTSYREYHRRRIRELFCSESRISGREADRRYDTFSEAYRRAWCLFEDVLPCLDAMSGISLGVLSNGNARQQRLKLERTGILNYFSTVIVSEEAGSAKPGSAIFLEACRKLDVSPEACVYVGDRLTADARSSCDAGLRGIWLNRGSAPIQPNIEMISSLRDLHERLLS